VLLRLSYLAVSSVFTNMRLLPMSDTEKDIEILALRYQLAILQRQIDTPRLTGTDRVFLAALLHRLPANGARSTSDTSGAAVGPGGESAVWCQAPAVDPPTGS
jgi:hypothetical protein